MKTRKAFTFIELLLGISIFSVVALCVYNTFATGIQINRRAQGQGSVSREIRWSLNMFSSEIENMLPYDFSNSYPDKFACAGQSGQLTFIAAGPQGLKVISYYLASPQAGKVYQTVMGQTSKKNVAVTDIREEEIKYNSLMRKERLLIDYLNGDPDKGSNIETIAAHIKEGGLKFTYGFKGKKEGTGLSWKNEWKDKRLPSYVRIELQFIDPEQNNDIIPVTKDVFIPVDQALMATGS